MKSKRPQIKDPYRVKLNRAHAKIGDLIGHIADVELKHKEAMAGLNKTAEGFEKRWLSAEQALREAKSEIQAYESLLREKADWAPFVSTPTSWTLRRLGDESQLTRGDFGVILNRKALVELIEFLNKNRHLLA